MSTFNMTRDKPIKLTFGQVIKEIIYDVEPYTGEYVLTPKTTAQTIDTAKKRMTDDVTVLEIPYAETSNESGTTVVIAS